jgi:Tfp pilus assembly protein PilF
MKRVPFRIGFRRLRVHEVLGAPLLVAFLLALACLARPACAQTTGIVTGRVTNSQGQPQAVLVHLLADGDIPAGDAYSDSNGSYVFMGLTGGTYAVVVEVEGYKPFRGTTRLDERIQPRGQVMVVLEPATKATASKRPVIPGSKSSGEFNAKHPLPPFDPKAVKEFDEGNKEQQKGNSQAALERYRKALRIDVNFFPALNNMGTLLERQGNHTQAKEAFLKAAGINPDDGEAYINLGHVLYEEGQYGPAVEQLKQGLQRSPQSAAGNFFLGSAYFKLHETEKSETLLKKACALDPQHMAPAHLQLANLYLQRHDYGAAKVQLQTYLQLNPSSPQAPAIKKMLADLAKDSMQ